MSSRTVLLAALATLFSLSPATSRLSAQAAHPVSIGDRVLVNTADGLVHDGRVRVVEAGLMEVQPGQGGPVVSINLARVDRLQVHLGRRRQIKSGTILGAAAGAVVGALWGVLSDGCTHVSCEETQGSVYVDALVLGAVGMPVGALVGALWKTDRWEDGVLVPQLRGSLSPNGRLRFSVSLPLGQRSR